jgi:NAD+ kinase
MRFGIVVNIQKETIVPILKDFLDVLIANHCDFQINQEARMIIRERSLLEKIRFVEKENMVDAADCLISFGGDGTLLQTARMIGQTEKPILGVNIGKLGYLTEVETSDIQNDVERLKHGKYEIEKRMVLEARWGASRVFALNDFAIVKSAAGRLIRVKAHVDGKFLNTYSADGLIIASPTGSTAYSLSANGPILSPMLNAFIINPICPHTLMARPLVISSDQKIQLRVERGYKAILTADGQDETELTNDDEVTIGEASHRVHLIRLGERTYFEILRSKLRWGEDARNNQ